MPLDFLKIWADTGDTSTPSDPQYLQGFSFLGSAPPTVELFNFLFQNIDQKLLSLFNISRQWQPGIEYSVGDVIFTSVASYKYMECTVSGTSGTTEPTWPSVGSTVNDNTVTWKIFDIRQGTTIGKILSLVDVGGGVPGLPAIDGSLLTNLPLPADMQKILKFAFINETQASGTAGGTFTSGAWRTRTLNTKVVDQIGITLSSNQILIPAGTFIIDAFAPAYCPMSHKARLQNITDSTTALLGTSEHADNSYGAQTSSRISGLITLASQKTFEVQHYGTVTNTFGRATSISGVNEIYTTIKIIKVG
jgi:hypothetical protein